MSPRQTLQKLFKKSETSLKNIESPQETLELPNSDVSKGKEYLENSGNTFTAPSLNTGVGLLKGAKNDLVSNIRIMFVDDFVQLTIFFSVSKVLLIVVINHVRTEKQKKIERSAPFNILEKNLSTLTDLQDKAGLFSNLSLSYFIFPIPHYNVKRLLLLGLESISQNAQ